MTKPIFLTPINYTYNPMPTTLPTTYFPPMQPDSYNPQNKPTKPNGDKYAADDGKISLNDKAVNFAKGLVSPITSMFKSPKNFLIGAAAIAAGIGLTVATGGAILPAFVAAGVVGGGIQLAKGIYNAHNATTDNAARQAWQGIGSGTGTVALSVIGSKGALKGAGIDSSKMGFLKSTIECFKNVPKALSSSYQAIKSGAFFANIKNIFGKKTANTQESQFDTPERPKLQAGRTEPEAPKLPENQGAQQLNGVPQRKLLTAADYDKYSNMVNSSVQNGASPEAGADAAMSALEQVVSEEGSPEIISAFQRFKADRSLKSFNFLKRLIFKLYHHDAGKTPNESAMKFYNKVFGLLSTIFKKNN